MQHEARDLISTECSEVDQDDRPAVDGFCASLRIYDKDNHSKGCDHHFDRHVNFDGR